MLTRRNELRPSILADYNDVYIQFVRTATRVAVISVRRIHMHIVTVAEMRELEARADREYGLTSPILMENAGKSAAEILVQHIRRSRSVNELEFLILVGPGNNGGDGLVMGRYLEKWGAL